MTADRTGYPSKDRPWLKYYSLEEIDGKLPEGSMFDYLRESYHGDDANAAMLYLGEAISYGEMFRQIDRATHMLLEMDVKAGDIIIVCLPSMPEVAYAVFAANRLGAVANMVHPLAGESELVRFIQEAQSRLVILLPQTYQTLRNSALSTVETMLVVSPADSLPPLKRAAYHQVSPLPKLDRPGSMLWGEQLSRRPATPLNLPRVDAHSPAVMVHTGGTSGSPKGVTLSSYNLNAVWWQIKMNFTYTKTDRMLAVVPPFTGYGLCNCVLEPIVLGFTVVLIPKYESEKIGEYLAAYHPEHINSIPQYWEPLLRVPKDQDLSYLCHLYTGGDAMSVKLEEQLNAALKERGADTCIMKGYGCTEMVASATLTKEGCNEPGSVGIPMVKNNMKIVKAGGLEELGYLEEGEICFHGPSMMLGYYDNQEATDDLIRLHPDGLRWLHTGDLGYVTEDGILYVSGRIKRIIVTIGDDRIPMKMFPDRIEKVLLQHAGVEACVVVAKADKQRASIPVAFVKPYDHVPDSVVEQLHQLCRDHLPRYMLPQSIVLVDDLPRTKIGKVDYRRLEEQALEIE